MLDATGPFDPSEITGCWSGSTVLSNYTLDKVWHTPHCNVRYSKPSCPFPLWECTDSKSTLRCKCTVAIVLYVGYLMIGKIVRRVNDSNIFLRY